MQREGVEADVNPLVLMSYELVDEVHVVRMEGRVLGRSEGGVDGGAVGSRYRDVTVCTTNKPEMKNSETRRLKAMGPAKRQEQQQGAAIPTIKNRKD